MQGWSRGVRGAELFQMLQESFAWLPSTGFPTADPNVTLTFPVVVAALAASSHTAQASPSPSRCRATLASSHVCPCGAAFPAFAPRRSHYHATCTHRWGSGWGKVHLFACISQMEGGRQMWSNMLLGTGLALHA